MKTTTKALESKALAFLNKTCLLNWKEVTKREWIEAKITDWYIAEERIIYLFTMDDEHRLNFLLDRVAKVPACLPLVKAEISKLEAKKEDKKIYYRLSTMKNSPKGYDITKTEFLYIINL